MSARRRPWLEPAAGEGFEEPPRLETHDVEVLLSRDAAFSHFLSHVSGIQKTGQRVEMWFRAGDLTAPAMGREIADSRDTILVGRAMGTGRVKALTDEILGLPEPERAELAEAVLPALLTTPVGLAGVDQAVEELSDAELVALVERARRRRQDVTDEGIAAVIAEALRAVRAPRRP
jgi:hypothetical protein